MKYQDQMGHVYDVPPEQVEEFERHRTILLSIKIFIQILVIGALIYWNF